MCSKCSPAEYGSSLSGQDCRNCLHDVRKYYISVGSCFQLFSIFLNNPNAKKYKKEERCENVNSIAQLCDTSNLTLLEDT